MLTKHLALLCFSLLSGLTTSLLTVDKVCLGKRKAPFFSRSFVLTAAATTGENERPIACLTPHEDQVYHFLQDIQNKDFRIVVIGNGAILESTHSLGPSISISPSPKSGVNLITFAARDKSFELHLQLSQVSKVDLVEKETPSRTMRILRLSDGQGKSMCSLILSEDSQENAEWFQSLKGKYGETWQI